MAHNPKNITQENPFSISEEEIKREKRKRRNKFIAMGIVILAVLAYAIVDIYQNEFTTKRDLNLCQKELKICTEAIVETANNHFANYNYTAPPPDTITQITTTILTSINKIFESPYSLPFKVLIFLGVIYLIQVTFSLALDIVDVVILIFVIIRKIIKFVYSKIKVQGKRRGVLPAP